MEIKREHVKPLYETNYLNLYDLQYQEGRHYFDATRRKADDIVAIKSKEAFQEMLPDAVSCVVVLNTSEGKKLLFSYEYRYPLGQFVLSVPAGLIDAADAARAAEVGNEAILKETAIREIKEETGLTVGPDDIVKVINPCLFSTPGMSDESNALMYVEIKTDDLEALSQTGALGTELFDGFELLDMETAKQIFRDGYDKHGLYYSIYTEMALAYFLAYSML